VIAAKDLNQLVGDGARDRRRGVGMSALDSLTMRFRGYTARTDVSATIAADTITALVAGVHVLVTASR
jgi:hypothetical protein